MAGSAMPAKNRIVLFIIIEDRYIDMKEKSEKERREGGYHVLAWDVTMVAEVSRF